MPSPQSENSPENSPAVENSEIIAHCKELIALEPRGKWTGKKHIALIIRLLIELGVIDGENKQDRKAIKATLAKHGIGGNASQFAQWLAKQDGISLERNRLAEYDID